MATIRRTLSNEDRVKITRFLSLHRGRTPCQFIEGDKRGSFSRSHHNRFLFARQKRPIDRDGLTINPLFFVLQGRNLLLYALQSDPNVFASARCLRCQSSYRKKEEPPRPPAKKKRPLQFSCALPCYIQHFSADVHGDNPATGSITKIPSRSATSRTFPHACRKSRRRSFLTPRRSGTPSTKSYQRAKRSYFSDISREVKCTGTL